MKLHRQILAALTLLLWFAAKVHVALDHGGTMPLVHAAEDHHDGHDDEDGDDHGDGDGHHHHHDLGAAQFTKSSGKEFSALAVQPFYELAAPGCDAALRVAAILPRFGSFDPPLPDARLHGWLFVVRTALPVRGPSPAV